MSTDKKNLPKITSSPLSITGESPPTRASLGIHQVVYSQGKLKITPGNVIVETAVSLTVNGELWLTLLCTPIHLEALGLGFLYNEGVIAGLAEVASVRVCPQGDNVDIWLAHSVEKPKQWTRTSGCSGGITGVRAHLDEPKTFNNGGLLSPTQISDILAAFNRVQLLYHLTGGVHTSALSDGLGIILVAEDIGRHNTLDKLAGLCLMGNNSPARRVLLTTGRISSEMLQKAVRLRTPIVISRTSPSSRSVEMAETSGITLIGYARRDTFIVYSHPERIYINDES